MSIRESFKKKVDFQDGKSLLQVRIPDDLLLAVDEQIERDKKAGFDLDRTALVTACLINYLRESANPRKRKRA
jgi:hypothetical protein